MFFNRGHSIFLTVSSALACVAYSSELLAQQADLRLEEVVVTAQKRDESMQDVALSVTAVSGEQIADMNLFNMQALAPYVTNFYEAKTPTFSVITIRGLGSAPNPGFEQSVAMYNDGVYWGRGRQMVAPLFDLHAIEVLKGPQSILFGKNSIAGAVTISSEMPTDELSGYGRVLYGEDEESKIEAAISGPITDHLKGRLVLYRRDINGWVDNEFSDNSEPKTTDEAYRGLLRFEPVDTLTMTFKYEQATNEIKGSNYQIIQATLLPGIPGTPDPVPVNMVGQEDRLNYKSNSGNSAPLPDNLKTNIDLTNAFFSIDMDIGENTLTLLSGYSYYKYDPVGDLDFTAYSIIGVNGVEKFDQWSQEIRFASPVGQTIEYMAGAYYQKNTLDIKNNIWLQLSEISPPRLAAFPNAIDGIRVNRFDQDSETWSAFIHATWNINDRLRTSFGLRYTDETKDLDKSLWVTDYDSNLIDLQNNALLALIWEQGVDVVPYDESRSRHEDDWSPSLTLEYDVTEDTMAYASWTRGFKGGGFDNNHSNGDNIDDVEYKEETADSYEIGAKMSLLDDRAEVNMAVFHTKYDNLQVSVFNGTTGFLVTNAAAATSQGVEIEGRILLTESLLLRGNAAYLDFEYDEYPNGQCTVAQNADQLVSTGSIVGCEQDLKGETTNYAPEWAASVGLQHTAYLPANLQLLSTLDANYRDSTYLSADLDPALKEKANTIINLRVALTDGDSWEVAVIGQNLTDQHVLSTGEDVPFGNGNFYGVPDYQGSFYGAINRPRSWAVEGVLRF